MTWTPSSSYTFGPPPREAHRITTSATELLHLTVAFLVLTFDIALLLLHIGLGTFYTAAPQLIFATEFGIAAALTGFLSHEIAHKIAAQRLGMWAEFRASVMGLVLSVVTAAIGFLFAAPGATVVDGYGDLDDWGRISIAGPAVNFVFGLVFLGTAEWASTLPAEGLLASALALLAFFNGWFAAFNLIPFGPLDGAKVWRWNHLLWAGAFAFAAILAVVSYIFVFIPGVF